MLIGIHSFVRRQTAESPFSHYAGTFEEIAALVEKHFDAAKPSYRDGVVSVPVPAAGFFSPVVQLSEGDKLVSTYEPRRPDEPSRKGEPRLPGGKKLPAVAVEVDVYRRDVLLEDEEPEALTGADWEIVNIRAKIVEGDEPMPIMTLLYNHFHTEGDGGTASTMSAEQFQDAMRESFLFWKDKAMIE